MVGIDDFLRYVHDAPRAASVEELSRSAGLSTRSVYRWHRTFGQQLRYFPTVDFAALGLLHVHLFLRNPHVGWDSLPYAIRGEWLLHAPGERTLYLHCLIPRVHERDFGMLLDDLREAGMADEIELVHSEEGWQHLGEERMPRRVCHDAWDVVSRYPLIIPIVFEMLEHRRSMPAVWLAVRERLGARVWEYLPRGARRLPHNGKRYVREVLALLNTTFLFRQHVIRLPDDSQTIPVLLRTTSLPQTPEVPTETYRTGEEWLVHTRLTLAAFRALLRAPLRACLFCDEPVQVRFCYELLIDVRTMEWLFPREEIIARLSR
jgi:hypothetical protein